MSGYSVPPEKRGMLVQSWPAAIRGALRYLSQGDKMKLFIRAIAALQTQPRGIFGAAG
jgi:hypothetical protein